MQNVIEDIIRSWSAQDGLYTIGEICSWINDKNNNLVVKMSKIDLSDSDTWFLNEHSEIVNVNGSFFKIRGIKTCSNGHIYEQPIICQDEIGYLGIICKRINGILHFLMQAKIEPGNINKVQISPTIQATKSNFEQRHGGNKPFYLDFFEKCQDSFVVVDQIQSEQAGRFWKKRNRNIVLLTEKDIDVMPSFRWMTLGQIKELMKIDNLVNMDTRTVLSCLPLSIYNVKLNKVAKYFRNKELCRSIFNDDNCEIVRAFNMINDYKMFSDVRSSFCRLDELSRWKFENKEFKCIDESNYKVVFYDIEIEGREVKKWNQPLIEANGNALFVLFVCNFDGKYKFLVRLSPESCSFDKVEFGPTIQNESLAVSLMPSNIIEKVFFEHIKNRVGVLNDVILSEEGGRFFQEQNRNVIIEIEKNEMPLLPKGYAWFDYKTLNYLIQFNNVLNIQLRNLLSLLEI